MEPWRKLWLVDASGQPLSTRVQGVLRRLLPRVRRQFPVLRDKVALTEILEEAGRRIARHEERSGLLQKLDGYAWAALRSVGISRMRRGSNRLLQKTLEPEASRVVLSSSLAQSGTAEEIEHRILFREVLAQLTPDEELVFTRKMAGFSSEEIARQRRCSVVAVDTLFSRGKRKIRSVVGIQQSGGTHRDRTRRLDTNISKAPSRDERDIEGGDGE